VNADLLLFCLSQLLAASASACLYLDLAVWFPKVASATTLGTTLGGAIILRIVLGPVLGPIGDRLPRLRLVVAGHLWSALLNAGIVALTMTQSPRHVLPVIVLYMLLNAGKAINDTVTPALLTELVSKASIPLGVQLSNAALTLSGVFSGLIYGALTTGSPASPLRAVIPMAPALAAVVAMALRPKASRRESPDASTAPTAPAGLAFWRDARAGLTFVRTRPLLLQLAAASMLMFSALGPLTVALPVLINERNLPPWLIGATQTAGSVGILVGIGLAGFVRRLPTLKALVAAMALGGLATILAGGVASGYALVLAMALVPLAINLAFVTFSSSLTMALRPELQSRVNALFSFMVGVGVPVGMLVSGPVIEAVGAGRALVACGVGICVLAPCWLLVPRLGEFCQLEAHTAAAFLDDAEAKPARTA
jgi:MFS family permease